MKATFIFLVALCSGIVFSSCKSNNPVTTPTNTNGTVTPVGTPIGTPSSSTIGALGGSLLSPDGRLEIIIPANALSAATQISIQPVTNTIISPAGIGFSLLPNGQTFTVPVTLRFHYGADDISGSDALALGIATQRDDKIWHAFKHVTLDTTGKTLTVQTSHFSAYSIFNEFFVTPQTADVEVSKTVALKVLYVIKGTEDPSEADADNYIPLGDEGDIGGTSIGKDVNWSVNGDAGGNANDGKVSPSASSSTTTYTAPSTTDYMFTKPVAIVTAELQIAGLGKLMMNSAITVHAGKEFDFGVSYKADSLSFASGAAMYSYYDTASFHITVGANGDCTVSSLKNKPGTRTHFDLLTPCKVTPFDQGDNMNIDSVHAVEYQGSIVFTLISTRKQPGFSLDCGGNPVNFAGDTNHVVYPSVAPFNVAEDNKTHTIVTDDYPHEVITVTVTPK